MIFVTQIYNHCSLGRLLCTLEAFEQIKDKSKLRDTYDILGSLYFAAGNYEKALENYQEYYDREHFMPTLLNIVDCYVLLGNEPQIGTIQEIYDERGSLLYQDQEEKTAIC